MSNETFWDKQAEEKGVNAVNFDANMHLLENRAIIPQIQRCKRVLDLGCGNGMTTKYLAEKYPGVKFTGIDVSAQMIESAKKHNSLDNIVYSCSNAMDVKYMDEFDAVIGKRLLINVLSVRDRLAVLQAIENALKENGKYLMVENFVEPLDRVNEVRRLLGYAPIIVHEFNKYLTSDIITMVQRNDLCMIMEVDFGSLYYFMSRVFNADGSYESQINKNAVKLSIERYDSIIQGYCPEKMIIFEKMKDVVLANGDMP